MAGTAKQYSAKAISQLTRITMGKGRSPNFRWPYQAKVMNTLENSSRMTGRILGDMSG
ncbi:hypothetical protein D3C87_2000300 [compost metagenome]